MDQHVCPSHRCDMPFTIEVISIFFEIHRHHCSTSQNHIFARRGITRKELDKIPVEKLFPHSGSPHQKDWNAREERDAILRKTAEHEEIVKIRNLPPDYDKCNLCSSFYGATVRTCNTITIL